MAWTTKITADEEILLTVHQNGKVDEDEMRGPRYKVCFTGGVFTSFFDPSTNTNYKTPTALCCAKLERHGQKKTNQWRGPRHVLVLRDGAWVSLDKL
jgi:hypothetical protein